MTKKLRYVFGKHAGSEFKQIICELQDGYFPILIATADKCKVDLIGLYNGDRLVAAVAFDHPVTSSSLKINFIEVDESLRGQGYGKAMLRAIFEHAQELCYERIEVEGFTQDGLHYIAEEYFRLGEEFCIDSAEAGLD